MTVMLEARALRKSFGGLVAVDDVSFTLSRAERVALIGPNGAGKSTCFNLLSGEATPDTGQIILDGTDISRVAPHLRQRAGLGRTFQIAAVFRSMTVSENITTALIAAGRSPDNRRALLAEVGLAGLGARLVTDLAYGDIKRVEMAMALAARPKVLLLDEPHRGHGGTGTYAHHGNSRRPRRQKRYSAFVYRARYGCRVRLCRSDTGHGPRPLDR